MPAMRMVPLNIPESPMPIASTLLPPMVGPPMGPLVSITIPTVLVPPPPGSQFTPLRPCLKLGHLYQRTCLCLLCYPWFLSHLRLKEYLHHHLRKLLLLHHQKNQSQRERVDDTSPIPEDQFLAHHPGSVHISISVPKVDEGNLKGQTLEISVQSLTETTGSVKEKTA